MEEDIDLTAEEREALEQLGYGYPKEEEKQNIFSFFKRVILMPDTSRTSNLTEEELGHVRVPVRTFLELNEFSNSSGLRGLGNHFQKEAMVITNTALSREGFLDKLAVTQKRQVETKRRGGTTENKGWFKKKEVPEPEF